MKIELAIALWAIALPGAAVAEDLLKVYDDALQSDPQMREATATRMATLEAKPQARALLLPQIAGSASIERDKTVESQSSPASTIPLPHTPRVIGSKLVHPPKSRTKRTSQRITCPSRTRR